MEFTPWSSMRSNSDAYITYNNTGELNSKIYTYWSKNMFDQHLRTLDKSLDKMYFSKKSSVLGTIPMPNIMDAEPKKGSQGIIKSLRSFFGDYMMQSQNSILNNNRSSMNNALSITVFTNLGISPELFNNDGRKKTGNDGLFKQSDDDKTNNLINNKLKEMSLDEKTNDQATREKAVNTMVGLNQFQELKDASREVSKQPSQKSLLNTSKRKGSRGPSRLQSKSYAVNKKQLHKKQPANRPDLVEVIKDDINTLSEIEWSSTDDEKLGEEKLKITFRLAKKKKAREITKETESPPVDKAVEPKIPPSSSDSFDSEDSYYVMSEPSKKRSSDSDSICIISTDIDSESDKDLYVLDKVESSDSSSIRENVEINKDLPMESELNYIVPKVDHFVTSESSENEEGGNKKRKESLIDAELIATEILSSMEDTDFKNCTSVDMERKDQEEIKVEVDIAQIDEAISKSEEN